LSSKLARSSPRPARRIGATGPGRRRHVGDHNVEATEGRAQIGRRARRFNRSGIGCRRPRPRARGPPAGRHRQRRRANPRHRGTASSGRQTGGRERPGRAAPIRATAPPVTTNHLAGPRRLDPLPSLAAQAPATPSSKGSVFAHRREGGPGARRLAGFGPRPSPMSAATAAQRCCGRQSKPGPRPGMAISGEGNPAGCDLPRAACPAARSRPGRPGC